MRIGARSGDHIRYSDELGKNTLWVKPFGEAVLEADFSIFPRWTPRAVLLADQALKADEVIEVTLSAMPYQADEERLHHRGSGLAPRRCGLALLSQRLHELPLPLGQLRRLAGRTAASGCRASGPINGSCAAMPRGCL